MFSLRFVRPALFLVTASALAVTACSRTDSGDATRTTTTLHETDVAGIVTVKKETTTTEPVATTEDGSRETSSPPQAGLLTAGDVDDILNADAYARYASRFLQTHSERLPFVDTRRRVAIKVVDSQGRGVPFAHVEVQRPGKPLHLVAAADGSASLYPSVDNLPSKAAITVASGSAKASREIDLSGRSVSVSLPGAARPVTAMDLALVIDTTGSMGDEMSYLQAELDSIVTRLKRDGGNLDLRIGVVVYRDTGDDYVVRSAPLTADISAIREMLSEQEADGGGDTPEAVDQAMAAAERMQWRSDAAKALVLVADAPPHDSAMAATLNATERLRSRGVQIVPVAASGVEDNAQYVMRTMAALTQGRYIFLTDDSGVGNAHAEPDVACYVVTRLDQLIGRVLAGIAKGTRIEPGQGEVIRAVGNYHAGRCAARQPQTT